MHFIHKLIAFHYRAKNPTTLKPLQFGADLKRTYSLSHTAYVSGLCRVDECLRFERFTVQVAYNGGLQFT